MKYIANVTTLTYIEENCTGCKVCVDVCPHSVFWMNDKKVVIIDRDRCMECGACALNCEFGALEVRKGVGCAQAIIHSLLFGGEPTCGCSETDLNTCCC